MLTYEIQEIAKVIGGQLLQGDPHTSIKGICTDSRKAKGGEIFVALQGQQDGHNFIAKALDQGVTALLVSQNITTLPAEVPVVLVADTLAALQQLASDNRSRLNIPVVAVTGSNGKTSTKDMLAAVLSTRFNTLKTEGNFNNELGLPLTLLNLTESHQAAVVEMGMRGLGEIHFLAEIAKPTAAVITNIGEAHLERLGSVRNIAMAKTEVLEHITPEGFAVLNADSPFIRELAERCQGQVIFYSVVGDAELKASNIRPDGNGVRYELVYPGGFQEIYLPVPGSHNVMNSLAAVGVGLQLGLSIAEIEQGLRNVALTHSRLEILQANGINIINDTYNANPSSTKAALQVLKETAAGRKIAVLGDMYELGEREQVGHQEVGEAAAAIAVDALLAVGNLGQWIAQGGLMAGLPQDRVVQCENNAQAVAELQKIVKPGDTLLIKGSRGMRMEEIVKELTKC